MFLAMTNERLGQPERAKAHLQEGAEIFDARLPRRDSDDLGLGWSDWLFCEIVRRKAEELLGIVLHPRGKNSAIVSVLSRLWPAPSVEEYQ